MKQEIQPIVRDFVAEYVKAGYRLTPLNGKIPKNQNWIKTEYNANLTEDSFIGNYGVVLQKDDLVVDVDVRRFPKGENPLKELAHDLGIDFRNTFIVRTGGGGLHIYFKKPENIEVRNALKEYAGIEYKSFGQQVVGAGCLHPETGKQYSVYCNDFKPIQAPENLLRLIQREEVALKAEPDTYEDSENNIFRYIAYLKNAEPAIEGQNGDLRTFQVACRGRDFALSAEKTYELMSQYWNDRCVPSWEPEDLKKKVQNAYTYNRDVVGKNNANSDFKELEGVGEQTEKRTIAWDVTKDGNPKTTSLRNVKNYLLYEKSPLFESLAYNEFTREIEFIKPAPWHKGDTRLGALKDIDIIQYKAWLSEVNNFNTSTALCFEALQAVAHENPYHPIRDYLSGLVWDKKPRIDTWLIDFLGVKDTKYTRAVSSKILMGAVARIIHPGVKFDTMLVLEGKQGIGKSTVVKILGGDWYDDIYISEKDKDTVSAMHGKWIMEVSEMVCARKADVNNLKSFLSKAVDRIRPAYARCTEDFPRQGIFIGTTNPEFESSYLRDTTGNRRFWPVECFKVDFEGLISARDQLFAEALSRYLRGEKLYLDEEISKMAEIETESRMDEDGWKEQVEEWLARPDIETGEIRTQVTANEILEGCIGIPISRVTQREQRRIANIMVKNLGWERKVFRHKKKQGQLVKGYEKRAIIDLREFGLE